MNNELPVEVDLFKATRIEERKYKYELQLSKVSKAGLLWLIDSLLLEVTGAWLQPDFTYIVQCKADNIPPEIAKYVLDLK